MSADSGILNLPGKINAMAGSFEDAGKFGFRISD